MKPKFKKLIKAIVFVLIPILLWNCSTEELGVKNSEAATKTFLEEINQAKLSLDELKKDPKINTILNDAFKGIKQNNPYQKNQNNLQKIELSNAVTKFSRFDYTSYTIPILNRVQNHNSFQNIVIETDNLRDAAYLITYFPNKNYKKAKNAQNINEDQTIYYMASSKIEYLYYKRKINTFPNNPSTQKTVSSTNPLIEESLVICVITYTPGHNCTAGGNDAVGESCSGVGSERATGPVVSESCTNIPEAPPTFPNDPPGGGEIGPDDSSYGSGGGMILLPIDPLADYPKKWICMNPPQCSELIPYTPILTIPMDDPYNFYTGILSFDQITTLLRFEYSEVKNAIDDFLLENQNENGSYNTDVTDMVREMVNASIILDVNAVSVWNDYDNFKNQMASTEKVLFDNLLPNRKLWYMCAAKKAVDKAKELFPTSLHNGKGDALRHALWNGISTLLIGNELTKQLTDAHESKPAPLGDKFNYKEVEMDLYNNNKGRETAMVSNITNIIETIIDDLSAGYLRYLNNLDSNSLATYNSSLIPTDQ